MHERSLAARTRSGARQNPPATAGGIAAAVVAVYVSLAHWAITLLPAGVPGEVTLSLEGLVLAGAAVIGAAVGKLAQRYTYPAEFVEAELLDAEHALDSARAAGDLED